MTIRFISDIHLEESRPLITRAFFNYLTRLPADTKALYLLGDIFDAWIGDDDDNPFLDSLRDKLKQTSARGIPLYFMHGNRDFLVGDQFAQQTGCQLLNDPCVIEHHGQRYLLSHGDILCTDDTQYQAFRAQMRNPAVQAMLLAKPLSERREIAKQLRQQSGMANSNKAQDIMDVNLQAVTDMMDEYQVETLIHGHTHRPAIHTMPNNKRRIVLGDWHDKGWEITINNTLELHSFAIHSLTER